MSVSSLIWAGNSRTWTLSMSSTSSRLARNCVKRRNKKATDCRLSATLALSIRYLAARSRRTSKCLLVAHIKCTIVLKIRISAGSGRASIIYQNWQVGIRFTLKCETCPISALQSQSSNLGTTSSTSTLSVFHHRHRRATHLLWAKNQVRRVQPSSVLSGKRKSSSSHPALQLWRSVCPSNMAARIASTHAITVTKKFSGASMAGLCLKRSLITRTWSVSTGR